MTRPLVCALIAIASWQLLVVSAHAQITVDGNRSQQLKLISDQAVATAGIKPTRFGETSLDWQALTPLGRAQLIQVLSGRQRQMTLQAWDGRGDPAVAPEELAYTSALVQIDSGDAANWWFEFQTHGRNPRRVRWQLSRLPFDDSVTHWRAPAGLVAQGEIMPIRGSSRVPNRFMLDLGPFLPGGQRSMSSNPAAVSLSSMLHGDFPAGTLYLRTVALGRSSRPISLPSPAVRIDLAPLTRRSPMSAATLPASVELTSYSALRPMAADARCWVRPTRPVTLAPARSIAEDAVEVPDTGRQLTPSEPVNLCAATNQDALQAVSSGYATTAALANELHHWGTRRFESAKESIRTETQIRYGGATAACSSACRQAIGLVLDQVVAVTGGVPASSDLVGRLVDAGAYIERMLIHAFRLHSGMGESFEAKAASEAAESFLRLLSSPEDLPPPGFETMSEKQQRSPLLSLRIGAGDVATEHAWLQLRELGKNPRLHPLLVPVPPLEAGSQINLPIELASTQLPDPEALMLPAQPELVAGVDSASGLLRRVSVHLDGLDKALAKAYAPARKGRYRIELAWRDAEGGLSVIGVATCDADRDRCRFKG